MIVREEVWDKCGECGRSKELREERVYGCDGCRKPISYDVNGKRHHDFLEVTVFYNSSDSHADHFHFCSWKCVAKKLKTIKCDYFVSLPTLYYEKDVVKGQHARDFLKLLK